MMYEVDQFHPKLLKQSHRVVCLPANARFTRYDDLFVTVNHAKGATNDDPPCLPIPALALLPLHQEKSVVIPDLSPSYTATCRHGKKRAHNHPFLSGFIDRPRSLTEMTTAESGKDVMPP